MAIVIILVAIFIVVVYFIVKSSSATRLVPQAKSQSHSATQRVSQAELNRQLMGLVNNLSEGNRLAYWANFKSRKPQQASDIERLLNKDMSKVSTVDSFQLVNTFLRWSANSNVPISNLKQNFLESFYSSFDGEDISLIIDHMKEKRSEEAKSFNISPHNTISNFMIDWIIEAEKEKLLTSLPNNEDRKPDYNIEEDSIHREKLSEKVDVGNIAPDISGFFLEENLLITMAQMGVDFMSENYKTLTRKGRQEALIYCSTCIIELPTDCDDITTLDVNVKGNRYLLLLHDKIEDVQVDRRSEFINSRVRFYRQQKEKLEREPLYTPMFIYNAFYLNPLCDNPGHLLTFNEPPTELFALSLKLSRLSEIFQEVKQEYLE